MKGYGRVQLVGATSPSSAVGVKRPRLARICRPYMKICIAGELARRLPRQQSVTRVKTGRRVTVENEPPDQLPGRREKQCPVRRNASVTVSACEAFACRDLAETGIVAFLAVSSETGRPFAPPRRCMLSCQWGLAPGVHTEPLGHAWPGCARSTMSGAGRFFGKALPSYVPKRLEPAHQPAEIKFGPLPARHLRKASRATRRLCKTEEPPPRGERARGQSPHRRTFSLRIRRERGSRIRRERGSCDAKRQTIQIATSRQRKRQRKKQTAYNSSSSMSGCAPRDIRPTSSVANAAGSRSRSSTALIGLCRSDSAKLMNPRPSPPPVELLSELAVAEGLFATERMPAPETVEKNWWCEISEGGEGIATG